MEQALKTVILAFLFGLSVFTIIGACTDIDEAKVAPISLEEGVAISRDLGDTCKYRIYIDFHDTDTPPMGWTECGDNIPPPPCAEEPCDSFKIQKNGVSWVGLGGEDTLYEEIIIGDNIKFIAVNCSNDTAYLNFVNSENGSYLWRFVLPDSATTEYSKTHVGPFCN